jgi:large subunit ribosomal protein L19
MNTMDMYEREHMRRNISQPPIGSQVKVHYRIVEGDKERIQIFEGTVIAHKKAGIRSAITVRKVTAGVGVERIFPLHSPRVDKLEVVRLGRVRRSKLYYLRDLKGKKARIREEEHSSE